MPEQMQLSFDSIPMTSDEKAVWAAIETHRGRGKEIQVNALSARLAMPERRVRQVVSHLVNTHARPIGSNGNGYYIATTREEVDAICASLRHRGIMILLRCARFQRASLHEVFGQAYIEFGETIHADH